ncbi:catalase [Cladophialophora psammophila CBS 110553]|uniref:Catalase n=1 Tax=Cladophialophora psammophila CBS 110553 TaxID=1182543 RepID=W9X282_9EURO|nr:catalase [Cladophialophora psammophila CBS 110553]EXJ71410.1 catalase [Cladophialophora psammophila CBS 110553]
MSQPHYTLAEGIPLPRNDIIEQLSTGSGGGYVLLTSTQLLENLAHFSRERIPERTVHAKAAGARGYYEVADDVSDVTDADFLNGIGKKTEVLMRISTVGPARGSADTVRDFRGFAVKFKTNEGNQDWVFNNQPVFFVRDPMKFPSLNRSHKPHPGTNASDASMFWDFHVNNQESIHALMFLFGDRGLPSSVRHVNGYSGNTYKFTKDNGASYVYTRITVKTVQGIHYYTNSEGAEIAGKDPDAHLVDLQEAINKGHYPQWDVYIQVIRPEDISKAPINIFDMTKVWPKSLYPLRKMGRITLDTNPKNWFAEIEQAAFSPSNMVPGLAASPDPMLQARMFAYPDAARYRLGVNYQFLPTNAAKPKVYCPIERDGFMNFTPNYGIDPNYVGTKLKPVKFSDRTSSAKVTSTDFTAVQQMDQLSLGHPDEVQIPSPISAFTQVNDQKDFEQATALWKIMEKQEGAQARFVDNVAAHASDVKEKWLREEVYAMFAKVDKELGERINKVAETKIDNDHAHPHKTAWH